MNGSESPTERRARLFAELCDLAADERQLEVERLAAQEPELAGDLIQMFESDAATSGPIEGLRGAVAVIAEQELLGEGEEAAPPPRLGAWRLGSRLGRGGMGEVWEAERVEGGFAQRAAIKLVRSGMTSRELVRRFAFERQVLAQLEHAAIAKVLDGGIAPDGRPWFAMERVDGVPITRFAEERELLLAERLHLFLEVCAAVDSAHRALVVHRDLKPSNILVTSDGAPKLLDFGLAKLLDLDPVAGSGELDATRTEMRALTPAYAAPEQILGAPITTATDVYALGGILFELLTGELPHRRRGTTPAELAAEVESSPTERPSQRLRRLAPGSVSAAALAARAKRLEGDLDTIVLKALARQPDRRYPSAAALAADLVAHLDGRPIAARPDSLGYRAGKFVRRHRLAVAAATLTLLAVVAGASLALVSAAEARQEARRAERVKALLADLLLGADPEQSKGAEITARELLAAGTKRIEVELASEPEVQADLLATISIVEQGLGLLEPALGHARQSLAAAERAGGSADPRLLPPLAALGGALVQLDRLEEGLAAKQRALDIARRHLDAGSVELAAAEYDFAQGLFAFDRYGEALPLVEHVLAVRREHLGEDDPRTIEARLALAWAFDGLDRYDKSIALGREVLASYQRTVGNEDPRVAEAHHNLAVNLAWIGRSVEALEHFSAAIEWRRRILGPRDFRLAWSLQQSSLALRDLERFDDADSASREALAIFEALDPNHTEAIACRYALANSEMALGRTSSAIAGYRRAAADWMAQRGPEHRSTLQGQAALAIALAQEGGPEAIAEGEALARATLDLRTRRYGAEGAYTAHSWFALGELARVRGDLPAARAAHEQALAIDTKLFGDASDTTLRTLLGLALDRLEGATPADLAEAEKLLDRAARGQQALDPEHSFAGHIDLVRARLAGARGNRAEGVRLALGARERIAARLGIAHPLVAACDREIAGASQGRPPAAEPFVTR